MSLAILVLAAGKGTRMESDLPKVLHTLRGKPLVAWVLEASRQLNPDRLIAIVGHKAELVEETIQPTFPEVEFVLQPEMKGTGHAVMQAEATLQGFEGDIVVTCGDAPLLTAATLKNLVEKRRQTGAAASMLIGDIEKPGSYGRVICDADGTVTQITEAKDASPEVLALQTVNAGTYCFESKALWEQLAKVGNDNKSGEYYLTDVVGLLTGSGQRVTGIFIGEREMTGVNTKAELAALEEEIRAEETGAGTTL
jgi:UDP-N-acetylglucosamine diphosphorylase/glucosamine-1-phosphate N-acetyltransferase